jgi:hypothetical protein
MMVSAQLSQLDVHFVRAGAGVGTDLTNGCTATPTNLKCIAALISDWLIYILGARPGNLL